MDTKLIYEQFLGKTQILNDDFSIYYFFFLLCY